MKLLISACLLGVSCRYDGRSKPVEGILELAKLGYELIPVCPEVLGGLPTPRPPAECQSDGRIINQAGDDVTEFYQKGAQKALEIAQAHGCAAAVLKEKSPSCGCYEIYDGSFSKRLVPGQGVTAKLLCEHQIQVLGETHLAQLIAK